MAIVMTTGFEFDAAGPDSVTVQATAAYSQTQARTGVWSIRCNPASGGSGYVQLNNIGAGIAFYFGIYIATMPTVARIIAGEQIGGIVNIRLNTDGTLSYLINTTVIGTSAVALNTGAWHYIAFHQHNVTASNILFIDGVAQVNATTTTISGVGPFIGCWGSEASAIDIYIDDIVVDDSSVFPKVYSVGLLRPISDNAVGTGWTNDAAGTSGIFSAVDNTPPAGIADTTSGSGQHQIRNSTSNANVNYDTNLQTYASIGINPYPDQIDALWPVIVTGAPVSTNAKQGTVGVSSNPVIANVALGSSGTAGAFWSGTAAGTYSTGWKNSWGTMTLSPTVTTTSSPVMRVTQVTSNNRVAMVCAMGLYVVWERNFPLPYTNPIFQALPQ